MSDLLRALIVEDSRDDAAQLLRELRGGGYDVVSERVETALGMNAALDRAEWDVILSDYTMPSFSALDALTVINNRHLDIPFIIISGTIGEETAVAAMRAGAQDFLVKGKHLRLIPALERELRDASSRRERRRAEEALRQSEERFRQIAETIDEVFWIADPNIPNLLYISPGYERVWGRSIASFNGNPRSFLESIHPDDREQVLAILGLQQTGLPFNHEYRIVRPDGAVRWIWNRGFPVRDNTGQVTRYVGAATDITDRKQAEAEKARLVAAIEQSAEAVMITNPAGNIEYVNPAFTGATGYSREEILGQNARILKSDKHESAFFQQLWVTILNGQTWSGELVNRRKNGSLYTEQMNIAAIRDARGVITHFIATKQDVTERKRLENQVRQAQKMEAVGRLAGGIAHDFNNLLTVLIGYTQLALDKLSFDDPLRRYLEEVAKSGNRAASLTRQLLAFSRQQVLAPRILDLNSLLNDVQGMLRRLIGEDIDLSVIRDSALWQVRADPGQIEQVLLNLAVNSRDAMPEGGTLVIETANVELSDPFAHQLMIIPAGHYAMLAVSDSGIGMDAETQALIFEPFFTTKDLGKGTGLGLATVYGIVKQSGGYIQVHSEPGHGTTFKILLPRVDHAVEPVRTPETPEGLVSGSETILLVEDEEPVRSLAARILQGLGYRVLESAGPENALQIAERDGKSIDLLLTDVVLPGMSGRKVAEHLTMLRPGLKVLYMSGYMDDSVVRHGVLEASTAFLQKPFTPPSLARRVREVLDAGRKESS